MSRFNEILTYRIISHFISQSFAIMASDMERLKDAHILSKEGKRILLWIKIQDHPISFLQIRNLFERIFQLEVVYGRIDGIYIVTNRGYSPSSYSFSRLYENRTVNLYLVTASKLVKFGEENSKPIELIAGDQNNKTYIGIFTCKGGVGKTTIAAHFAATLACHSRKVALLDLDPEQNLSKVTKKRLHVEAKKGEKLSIPVFNHQNIKPLEDGDYDVVVCDFSPALERNLKSVVEKLNYVLMPTTLNPLGLNSGGKVIKNSIDEIRTINKECRIFSFINGYQEDKTKRGAMLKEIYVNSLQNIASDDEKFEFVKPQDVCVRYSVLLYYWGMSMYDDTPSTVVFRSSSSCYPKEDYFALCEYIQRSSMLRM